jgi:hypothetical protein
MPDAARSSNTPAACLTPTEFDGIDQRPHWLTSDLMPQPHRPGVPAPDDAIDQDVAGASSSRLGCR